MIIYILSPTFLSVRQPRQKWHLIA